MFILHTTVPYCKISADGEEDIRYLFTYVDFLQVKFQFSVRVGPGNDSGRSLIWRHGVHDNW